MKSFNVQLNDTIVAFKAAGCNVSQSGALIFIDLNGKVLRVYNKDEWKEAWVV